MSRTIRQAIPNEEIEANMRNESRSTSRTRYNAAQRFINEEVAEARVAAVALVFGGVAILTLLLAIFSVAYAMNRIEAQAAPILAKSEMTKEQIKQLNIIKPTTEKRK